MNSKSSIFDSILNTIESEDIRKFAERCIETIPDYFWNVGASSTGKYHPQYALGDLGLARHTCALVRFLNHILAANVIRKLKGNELPDEEIEMIATTIESHMGAWNTDKRSSTVLPLPKNKYQTILHLADYLASRKDIEVLFNEFEVPKKEVIKLEDYVLNFGKHSGEKLIDVAQSDPSYISWAKENMNREPIKSLLVQL